MGALIGEETPTPSDSPTPATEVRTVSETEEIPFSEETVDDPSLPEGTEEVRVSGRAGMKRLTYEVTVTDGKETDRRLLSEEIIREPITEVVAVGTEPAPPPDPDPAPPEEPAREPTPEPEREAPPEPAPEPETPEPEPEPAPTPGTPEQEEEPASECDPNYAGGCVPIADDVDCAGGGGDGPEYVEGPVDVVGEDIYDLDRNGDGVGCEPD